MAYYQSYASSYKNPREQKGKSLIEIPDDYVVLDLETTGLNPERDDIIEIGVIRVRGNEVIRTVSQLLRPRFPISPFISELTGITNQMVQDAPHIMDVLPVVLDFIGNDIVVGHNVNFDINFIYDKCGQYLGMPFPNDFVDTLRLSRILYPTEKHHKLCDLEQRFHLHNEHAHRALSDVLLTNDAYQYMKHYVRANAIDLQNCIGHKSHIK